MKLLPQHKITIISGSYPPIRDGVGYYVKNLTDHFTHHNYQIITSQGAAKTPHTMAVVSDWGRPAVRQVEVVLNQEKPSLVHMQYPSIKYGRKLGSTILPLMIRRRFKHMPLLMTVHEYHDASWLGRKRVELMLRPVKTIIVSNHADEELLRKKFARKAFYRVPIGSNIPEVKLSPSENKKFRHKFNPKGKKLLLYWGFVDSSKGVDKLISAMTWLGTHDVRLLIASGFDDQNQYHREIASHIQSSGADIDWLGFLDDTTVSGLLQISDMVVLPFNQPVSLRRGSVLAAICHGRPVITTGPSEDPELKHLKNCYLLEDNLPQTIAAAIKQLLDEPKLATLIAEQAKQLAPQFDWKRIAKTHEEIYSKLISKD